MAGLLQLVKNPLHEDLLLVSGLKVLPKVSPVTTAPAKEMIPTDLGLRTLAGPVDRMSTISATPAKAHLGVNLIPSTQTGEATISLTGL